MFHCKHYLCDAVAYVFSMEHMSDRLRRARFNAGFKTASEAAKHFGWTKSTYIAHENGQNDFDPEQAQAYGTAYKVHAEMLLFGAKTMNGKSPGIDNQLQELPDVIARGLVDRFNAIIEGVKLGRKL